MNTELHNEMLMSIWAEMVRKKLTLERLMRDAPEGTTYKASIGRCEAAFDDLQKALIDTADELKEIAEKKR